MGKIYHRQMLNSLTTRHLSPMTRASRGSLTARVGRGSLTTRVVPGSPITRVVRGAPQEATRLHGYRRGKTKKDSPVLRSLLNLCNSITIHHQRHIFVIFWMHNGNIQAIGELLSYEFCEFLDETFSAEIRCHELSIRTYEPV